MYSSLVSSRHSLTTTKCARPISSGTVDEAAKRVDLVVDSRKLVVLDPNLPPDKRQPVQARMLGPEVLDSSQFHEIRVEANSIKQEAPDGSLVSENLSLHGKTRPISLHVSRSGEHFRGDTPLRQRDFGIDPITVAGGTVKVNDELKIEFHVVTEAASRSARFVKPPIVIFGFEGTTFVALKNPERSELTRVIVRCEFSPPMSTFLLVLSVLLHSILRPRVNLQIENLALLHQIGVLQRSVKSRTK